MGRDKWSGRSGTATTAPSLASSHLDLIALHIGFLNWAVLRVVETSRGSFVGLSALAFGMAGSAVGYLMRTALECRLQHKPSELSIGQQQRVALGRTLVSDPAVILADEPTGNLDPATHQQVLEFLKELTREGRTVIMVTHDPAAEARATRVVTSCDGGIVADSNALISQVA